MQAVQPGKPEERLLFLEQIKRAGDKTQIFLHDMSINLNFYFIMENQMKSLKTFL